MLVEEEGNPLTELIAARHALRGTQDQLACYRNNAPGWWSEKTQVLAIRHWERAVGSRLDALWDAQIAAYWWLYTGMNRTDGRHAVLYERGVKHERP